MLPYHKANPFYMGSKLFFNASHAGNLLTVIRIYLEARNAHFAHDHPLWLAVDGTTPMRRWFVELTKRCCGTAYSGHAFCTGGATFYARRGVTDDNIKCLGHWKLDAWTDYVCLQPEVAIAILNSDVERI
ncbi:hypothetical protein JCM1840_007146 [Sporobolomyces johnsonii]